MLEVDILIFWHTLEVMSCQNVDYAIIVLKLEP